MSLRERAAREGVGYAAARRWYAGGLLPVPARRVGGLVLVGGATAAASGVTAVCARVSSGEQKPGRGRRVAGVTAWAASRGLPAGKAVTGVGSAVDGHRRRFLGLLRDRRVETIVAGHRGRFARFGVEYAGAALRAQGRRLLAAGAAGAGDDLVRDVTEVLACLCARLYGRRAAAGRAARAVAVITGGAP